MPSKSAALSGENAEKGSLKARFGAIINNYFQIVAVRKNLIGFTASIWSAQPDHPLYRRGAFLFRRQDHPWRHDADGAGLRQLVNEALTFFVTYYVSLADFKAVLDRLISFDTSIENAATPNQLTRPIAAPDALKDIDLNALTLRCPDGRVIIKNANVRFAAQQPTLLTGPSGSGKSTLFRAISGHMAARRRRRQRAGPTQKVMLLPQKPYIPIGSLLAAVTYPPPRTALMRRMCAPRFWRQIFPTWLGSCILMTIGASGSRRRTTASGDCPRAFGQTRLVVPR